MNFRKELITILKDPNTSIIKKISDNKYELKVPKKHKRILQKIAETEEFKFGDGILKDFYDDRIKKDVPYYKEDNDYYYVVFNSYNRRQTGMAFYDNVESFLRAKQYMYKTNEIHDLYYLFIFELRDKMEEFYRLFRIIYNINEKIERMYKIESNTNKYDFRFSINKKNYRFSNIIDSQNLADFIKKILNNNKHSEEFEKIIQKKLLNTIIEKQENKSISNIIKAIDEKISNKLKKSKKYSLTY